MNEKLKELKFNARAQTIRDEALRIVARAKTEQRMALTELEGMSLLAAMGIETPRFWCVQSAEEFLQKARADGCHSTITPALTFEPNASISGPFPGKKAVIKIISPQILHKTEVQGVRIVENTLEAIAEELELMEERFAKVPRDGFTVNEFVTFEPKLGHEMIFGYRFAPDFGPIVSFGPGGIYAEYLASKFKQGAANLILSPRTTGARVLKAMLQANVIFGLLCAGLRNTALELDPQTLSQTIERFLDAADALAAAGIGEFEVNPMVLSKTGRLIALDCLVTLADYPAMGLIQNKEGIPMNEAQCTRPVENIERICNPSSAAVIGVSEKNINNGRIILHNLIENGFDSSRLTIVKAGTDKIDGIRCVPDIASLPEKVDLLVLVVPAASVPTALADIARHDSAWSVILIPGGLEEKVGSGAIVAEMNKALSEARARGAGPLINGGNCLGIRSVPGKYNTLFIPEYKLPMPKGSVAPLALISQSGAFAITRISKHPTINPKYTFTIGNQMDLTIGDYLEYLSNDPELHVFAVYIEGFKALDGEKTLKATKRISESGRSVIIYRAGKTHAGAGAAASHTASIAGDYAVTQQLFAQAGAVVCETLDEFDDAITLFTLLDGKKARGNRLIAVSNGGFECVAIADNLGNMELSLLDSHTKVALESLFSESRISEIADIHNPLDLTPMANDAVYEGALRAMLLDSHADVGIIGIVPLTAMLNTLASGADSHGENIAREDSIAKRCGKLAHEIEKPFVAVVDSGPLYDPLCAEIEKNTIPVFRTADRALKMLERWRNSPSGRTKAPF